MHADALDAQESYTQIYQNSGGGRTEKTRDRVKGLQPGRSENDNRTRARGTKIAAGTTSADGWATLCAKRQVAVIEMRAGQNGGPLPFEAIIELGEPIVNRRVAATEWGLRRTHNTAPIILCNRVCVRDASAPKSQHESVQFRNRRTLRALFATKRRVLRKS